MTTLPDSAPNQTPPALTPGELARREALSYYAAEFYLTGPDLRTDEEVIATDDINARGNAAAREALEAAQKAREGK